MPLYRCLFLREDGQSREDRELYSADDGDAHCDALYLLTRSDFSGFELWQEGRKVDEYELIKPTSPPDPRTSYVASEVEAQLRQLLRSANSPTAIFCAIRTGCDAAAGRARARTLAADLTWTLTDNL